MVHSFKALRLRRLRHRISKRELAEHLGCGESWINQLEMHGYGGPARHKWIEQYKNALEKLIEERKLASHER